MVSKTISRNAYKLDLPKTIRNHNVFQVSLLNLCTPPTIGQPSSEPHAVIIDDSEQWEVDRILDSKWRYRKLHYPVQWAGYSHVRPSWEAAANLDNTRELVEEFHQKAPGEATLRCWDRTNWTTCFLSFLLDTGPVQMVLARVLPPSDHSELEVDFPGAPDPLKGRPTRHQSVVGLVCFVNLDCGIGLLCLSWLWD